MSTEGIEAVFLETRNWGKSARTREMTIRDPDGRPWTLQAAPRERP